MPRIKKDTPTKYLGKKALRDWRDKIRDVMLSVPADPSGRKRVKIHRDNLVDALNEVVAGMEAYLEKDRAV